MTKNKIRDAEETKSIILKAAETLFAEKGYAGTTLRQISQASGASGPLIIFHFKDKQGVYDAVKANIMKRYLDADSKTHPADDSFDSLIRHVLSSMFSFYRDNPTIMRLANWGRLEGDYEPWPGEAEWHHTYREQIRLAQERGEIRSDLTPLNISIFICGTAHIWWENHEHFMKHVLEEKNRNRTADDFYFEQCLSFILQGLSIPVTEKKGKSHAKRTAKNKAKPR